ncbi:hypothetical protein B0H13DRAFT_2373266 [Mycena leptocephala]|nr:hypothetical protein B0H13DRAFT_2373266 [Mycena leptocephala]
MDPPQVELLNVYGTNLFGGEYMAEHKQHSTEKVKTAYEGIDKKIQDLAHRTGMVCAAFSRGHIHDKTIPTEVQSLGALDFVEEVVGEPARNIAEKIELWCIARDKGLIGADILQSMRKQVNKYIHTGLVTVTGSKKIAMNWVQHWKQIVLKRNAILRGWALEGDPRSPATIHDMESMRKLRDAFESGECYWVKLSGEERVEVEEMSDKNQPRKKAADTEALSTRSKAKGAPARRVWSEGSDDESDEEEKKKRARKEE